MNTIKILFEQKYFTVETFVELVGKDGQSGCKSYWISLCQDVVMEIVQQTDGFTKDYQLLWESFCFYNLVDDQTLHGKERSLKIIGWFEKELIKHDDKVIWPHNTIWQMIQRLGLGLGINIQDNNEQCMEKLRRKKDSLLGNKNLFEEFHTVNDSQGLMSLNYNGLFGGFLKGNRRSICIAETVATVMVAFSSRS